MSPSDVQSMLACPGISEPHKAMVRMRYVDGLRVNIVAKRLGVKSTSVASMLCTLRRKAVAWVDPETPPSPIDDAWHARQVAYVRGLEDEHHRRRYLNGIERAHGFEVANSVEAASTVTQLHQESERVLPASRLSEANEREILLATELHKGVQLSSR